VSSLFLSVINTSCYVSSYEEGAESATVKHGLQIKLLCLSMICLGALRYTIGIML
jgi:hypothetical protein